MLKNKHSNRDSKQNKQLKNIIQLVNPGKKIIHKFNKFFIYVGRLFYVGVRKFYDDECFGKAAILSYITILSVIPVLILIFGISSSFSSTQNILTSIVDDKIIPYLFPGEVKALAYHLEDFSKNALTLSILGTAFLVIAAVDIMLILENSSNSIWRVKKGRSILHNFLIYWAMITLVPLTLVSSFYLTGELGAYFLFGQELFQFVLPLLLTWIGFFSIYQFTPNTKIRFFSSSLGALIASSFWVFGKWGFGLYITQVAHETWGKIYGPLYIIPIFFFWIYLSYAILLFGMEISYLLQYPEIFKKKQYKNVDLNNFSLFFMLNSLYMIYKSFHNGTGSTSLNILARQNQLSRNQMGKIMTQLAEAGLVKEMSSNSKKEYLPIKPMDQIKIIYLINLVDYNTHLLLKKDNPVVVKIFNKLLERLEVSKNREFDNITYQDLMEDNIISVLSKG